MDAFLVRFPSIDTPHDATGETVDQANRPQSLARNHVNLPIMNHESILSRFLVCQDFAILLSIAPTSRPQN